MTTLTHLSISRRARLAVLVCIALTLPLLFLWRAAPAYAAGVVGNGTPQSCTGAALEFVITSTSGLITFNCGPNPVVVTITHNGGFNIAASTVHTIDGADKVTLTGAFANRLFDVRVGGTLTLSHIVLTAGLTNNNGNLPHLGGAILDEGYALTLDHVHIRNSGSQTAGGALEIITGTVLIMDSLIDTCASDTGGGIDNNGPLSFDSKLTLLRTTVQNNYANLNGGGGLNRRGTVLISDSLIDGDQVAYGNSAGGGVRNDNGALTINHTTLSGNSADYGGGIDNHGSLVLNDVTFDTNHAFYNGGGANNGGTLMTTNSSFTGNTAADSGGGIDNFGVLTVTNSSVSGNSAQYGGGIYNYFGTVSLSNALLNGNSTQFNGGGVYNNGGTAPLSTVTLSGNSTQHEGGGVFNDGGMPTLNNVTLSGNLAQGSGGGIVNYFGTLWLSNSTLNANSAGSNGGGVYNEGGLSTLSNSTLSGNSATSGGGGIENGDTLRLLNVTLSGNSATSGGGLDMSGGSSTSITNTILARSTTGGNCSGTISASKYDISSDNSCALAGLGDHNALDPLLTALGSPAIDGVVGNDAPLTDQRGLPRPGPDGSFDIGAVERQPGDSDLAPRLDLPLVVR